jgi:capsular polysaccharide export protein
MHQSAMGLGPLLVLGFGGYKVKLAKRLFAGRKLHFARLDTLPENLPDSVRTAPHRIEVLIWGAKTCPIAEWHRQETGRMPVRVEDGFLRSYGIGVARVPPNVFVFDRSGIYFDPHGPSDIEQSIIAGVSSQRLAEAERCLDAFRRNALSKYVLPVRRRAEAVYGEKTRPRVLVLGQVADDASILLGAPAGARLNDLVRLAALENPDCEILYKIHPDVLAGMRAGDPAHDEIEHLCRIIAEPLPLPEAFRTIDRVYTFTSLAGFEAVLHGLPVTVLGAPFYAGWGFTDDRWTEGPHLARRTVNRSALEVFAAAYLENSVYFDPKDAGISSMLDTIDRIALHRAHDIDTRHRGALKRFRVAVRHRLFGRSDPKSALIGRAAATAAVPAIRPQSKEPAV